MLKKYKPTTSGRRGMSGVTYRGTLTNSKPKKSLTKGKRSTGGRSGSGRMTVRHKGGGHKRLFRDIDFAMQKYDIPYTVKTVEYDPNRSGFIGLVAYRDGDQRYILLPKTAKVGDSYITSEKAESVAGNRIPLKKAPVGTFVYNIELKPGQGAKIVRSAGSYAEVLARDAGTVDLKMPSSEIRKVPDTCWATIGEVSNPDKKLENIGKAGRNRWKGKRPTVRGAAMNPVDHPMGGGEARSRGKRKHTKTKWGKRVDPGIRTRKPKKYSNKQIVARRKSKRR